MSMLARSLYRLIHIYIFMHKYTNFDQNSNRRVSFILITKNRAEYVDKALAGLMLVKTPLDELIVIDGGSTDRTAAVVQKYADIVDVFLSEPDLNGPHAHNKGILLSRGKYVKEIGDDDDLLYKEGLEQAIAVLEQHSEIDVLLCGGIKVSGEKSWAVYIPPGVSYGKNAEDVFRYSGATSGTGHIMRRSSFAKTGLIPIEYISADAAYVLQSIMRGTTVRFCRVLLYRHSINERSGGVRKAHESPNEWIWLAWQYSSIVFFCRYLVTHILQRRLRLSSNPLLKRCGKFLKRLAPPQRYMPEECIWDGGLSD